jgi:hypothetical protein
LPIQLLGCITQRSQRFAGTYCLHIQGRTVSQTSWVSSAYRLFLLVCGLSYSSGTTEEVICCSKAAVHSHPPPPVRNPNPNFFLCLRMWTDGLSSPCQANEGRKDETWLKAQFLCRKRKSKGNTVREGSSKQLQGHYAGFQ